MALVTAIVAEVPNHHTQTISDISITIPIQGFLKSVSTEKQKGQRRGSSIEHMPFTHESIITYEVHIKSKGEVGGGQRRVGWGEI
ncbi:hypothetical protein PABG_11855 [Paracoccidioides brasiliensis Pb03]|nr:hypothetical protein PABG_11855 [Paracoccidioides brasiliensis Pb03]